MKPSTRGREILALLRDRPELAVDDACEFFKISPATARRDFAALVEQGKADKTWGGLRNLEAGERPMLPGDLRKGLHAVEKQRIAARAATLCADGDIVFIDGGTTTLQMARWLATRPIRIVTNSLLIANEIDRLRGGPQGAEVFLAGGYLYPGSGLSVGPETVENLSRYRAAIAFLSVGGLSHESVSNNHHLVVEVERVMIARSAKTVLLADHSKFGRHELVPECSWDEVHTLLTDREPADNFKALLGDRLIVV